MTHIQLNMIAILRSNLIDFICNSWQPWFIDIEQICNNGFPTTIGWPARLSHLESSINFICWLSYARRQSGRRRNKCRIYGGMNLFSCSHNIRIVNQKKSGENKSMLLSLVCLRCVRSSVGKVKAPNGIYCRWLYRQMATTQVCYESCKYNSNSLSNKKKKTRFNFINFHFSIFSFDQKRLLWLSPGFGGRSTTKSSNVSVDFITIADNMCNLTFLRWHCKTKHCFKLMWIISHHWIDLL